LWAPVTRTTILRTRARRTKCGPSSAAIRIPPAENPIPVHPGELLATIYHAFGIDPETLVMNHLNQPRELVKAQAVTSLFA